MARQSFQYIFRFCCDPGFNDRTEVQALTRYVSDALIDDVAVFANVEELNTGHMRYEEQDVYLRLMENIRELLKEKGVTLSVNQWHSVMHADLGKALPPDQPFRPMVDINGKAAKLCVCPLCQAWQSYIGGLYARYAALDPNILWVEDDFRLHNHEPLSWGGCFCDEHMLLYSERAGKTLTREEFIAGVLQPGTPHPYRKIWLDVSRETMLSAARAIGNAVRSASGSARVGLMSSAPHIHAAEGRDWHGLLSALCQNGRAADRVHLPGYQEGAPSKYMQNFNMVSMLCAAMLPKDCDIYPELENYPFSLFSKSLRFTRFQLLGLPAINAQGVMLDLYDLNGNGIVWEEKYQDMLRDVKPFLIDMAASEVFSDERDGVMVLYSPDSAYTLHTESGKSMEELYPQEVFFGGLLPAMGVPVFYSADTCVKGRVIAISGQFLRNMDEDAIMRLLHDNTVLLNGDAVWTLAERGLGALAGIASVCWLPQNGGGFAYEEVTNGKTYRGRSRARASAVISASDAVKITYRRDAEVTEYTALFTSFRKRAAPGQVVVNGRTIIFPFGHFADALNIPPMFLSSVRQAVLQDMLRSLKVSFPFVLDAPYIEPYAFIKDGEKYLYLINASTDDVETIALSINSPAALCSVCIRPSNGKPYDILPKAASDSVSLPLKLPSMESALMYLNRKK